MKYLVWVASIVCLLLSVVPVSAREIGVKVGGAVVIDPSRWGGHISFEIPLSEEYPTNLAPFFEYYEKAGTKIMPLGLTLLYKARFSDYGGTVYFGAGGGVLMIRGQPGLGLVTGTDGMITAGGGLSIGLGERFGVYTQARWFRSFEDQAANNEISIQAGLQFRLGSE